MDAMDKGNVFCGRYLFRKEKEVLDAEEDVLLFFLLHLLGPIYSVV